MLVVIISWIYYFALCFIIGMGAEKLLAKFLGRRWSFQTVDYVVAGIAVITLYAGFFSIFYKVGMIAHLVLLAAAIAVGYVNRRELKVLLQKGKKLTFSWEGFFLFCFILLIAFFTSRGSFHTDTNIYHAQNIRIYEEYGLIRGMANLQLHYGYNSLYLAFAAFMSLSWLLPWSLHTTTGFVEVVLCLYALHQLKDFKAHKSHLEDAGCVCILFYALVNVTGSMSPATDYPTMFLSIYLIAVWLRGIEKKAHYSVYALLSVLAVFLGTMKLSAISMALVAVYPAYFLLKEKKWRDIAVYIGLGLAALAPYLIRNVLLSGWLIYPFEAIDLFSVPWKVPLEYLLVDSYQIKVWGRCLFDINLIDLPIREWLPIWWENQERYARMLLGANLLGLVLSLLNLVYKWVKKIPVRMELIVLYSGMLGSAVMWFMQAPFIRYGLAFLLAVPIIAMASWLDYEKKGLHSVVTGCIVFCMFLCFSPYIDHYVTDDGVFVKQRLTDPYYLIPKDYDEANTGQVEINGNTIYYCNEGEINSYHHFPNTCYKMMLDRSTLAGDEIKAGFVPK